MRTAFGALPIEQRSALETAASRIRAYHERQKMASWSYREADGSELGAQVTPLDRVGVYVPGGKAAYPSSVLMNVVPAHVAGVAEIVMVVPTPDGTRNPLVLAAAHLAGVTRAFAIGGAQAIAALAYGTATVPAVDKICGPGNAYVAAAKRRVFGAVGIDMVAGASEILVIADARANPDWVAMDLFSQAEHDELAQALLVTPERRWSTQSRRARERLIATMPRRAIIAASLANRGALIEVRDLDEACAIANRVAPEHLELAVADPGGAAAEDPPCRRHLHGTPHLRVAGRLLRGAEPRAADGAHCALLVAARRLRFPEALVARCVVPGGGAHAWPRRGDARARRRAGCACAKRRISHRGRIIEGGGDGEGFRAVRKPEGPGGIRPLLSRCARSDREAPSWPPRLRGDARRHLDLGGAATTHLIAVLTFDSIAAVKAALASPEGQATVADLANFATGGVEVLIADTGAA